jgi:hypothetical protein
MCNCIEKLDDELKAFSLQVDVTYRLTDLSDNGRMCVQTVKLDKKQRLRRKTVVANFCPICGEKYFERAANVSFLRHE